MKKTGMILKEYIKRLLVAAATLAMVITMIPSGVGKEIKVKADAGLSITLGTPEFFEDGSWFKLTEAEFNNNNVSLIYSLTVTLDKGSISNESCSGAITDDLAKHKTAVWTWADGKTIEATQEFVRGIKFVHEDGMKITVTADCNVTRLPSGSKITSLYHPIEHNNHYYMYVNGWHTWTDAYNLAKTYTYMGLRGYLVTVTDISEDLILDNITEQYAASNGGKQPEAWAAGIRVDDYYIANKSLLDKDTAPSAFSSVPADKSKSHWIWACGPEAGQYIKITGSADASNGIPSPLVSTYSNWNRPSGSLEPNNSSSKEWTMIVHFGTDGEQRNNGCINGWNDYSYSQSSIKGFFVEFSDYNDPDTGSTGYMDDFSGVTGATTELTIKDSWTYTGSGSTIEAYLTRTSESPECEHNSKSAPIALKLKASNMPYTGRAYNGITVENLAAFNKATGLSISANDVKYYTAEDTSCTNAVTPIAEGNYKAVLAIGSATISTTFKIVPSMPDWVTETGFGYDEVEIVSNEPLVIKLIDDTVLDKPLDVSGKDIVIDLNGKNLTGPAGQPVITCSEGTAEVVIEDTSERGKGKITATPSNTPGADGITTIDFTGADSDASITVKSPATVKGGNGSNGSEYHPDGGNGGLAIKTDGEINICVEEGASVIGGNGGSGCSTDEEEGIPGKGGTAVEGVAPTGDGKVSKGADGAPADKRERLELESEIDYLDGYIHFDKNREHMIIYANSVDPLTKNFSSQTCSDIYIDLTAETLVSDFSYQYYSLDYGKKWYACPDGISHEMLAKWFSKDCKIMITDKLDEKGKNPAEDSTVYAFAKICKRPTVYALKANYEVASDNYGSTNGQWVLVNSKNKPIITSSYEFKITNDSAAEFAKNCTDGADILYSSYDEFTAALGADSWGSWPEIGGVWVSDCDKETGKTLKAAIEYRIQAGYDSIKGYTAASKIKKLSVSSIIKAPAVKVDYKKEVIKLKKGMSVYFGDEDSISYTKSGRPQYYNLPAPAELLTYYDYAGAAIIDTQSVGIKVPLSLTPYITTDRNTLRIWQTATSRKPASAVQTILLAPRYELKSYSIPEVNVDKGKIQIPTGFEVYNATTRRWGKTYSGITTSASIQIRYKADAVGGKETKDYDKFATGEVAYLVAFYGTYMSGSKEKAGIEKAQIFLTEEEANQAIEQWTLSKSTSESEDIVDIIDDSTPMGGGDVLPQTGVVSNPVFFLIGMCMMVAGAFLMKKH